MYHRWAELLFLHWVVPPEAIRPLLPPGLTLDTFAGRAYVGLVPFTMTGVRPVPLPPFPPLSNFHETNVRTYVHYQGRDPGVWFFSLDAANALAVRIARVWYKLPYYFARIRLQIARGHSVSERPPSQNSSSPAVWERSCGAFGEGSCSEYRAERLWPEPLPAACRVVYAPSGPVAPAAVGTLEHFLVERYLLYACAKGQLYRGSVHHSPYPLQTASVHALEENLIAASGIERPDVAPLAHYAKEVRVEVFALENVA
jgi:uncharacterized protein YqjF (DUF2071 family)